MKKMIFAVLLISFLFVLAKPSFASTWSEDAGAELKSMGLLKGFADGTLKEDKLITQGEYLALLSRVSKKLSSTDQRNLVTPTNRFDRFVNNAYRKYVIIKTKLVNGYYQMLSYLPNYEVIPGIKKDHWFFKDAIYLKRIGFEFPEDFSPDKRASKDQIYQWLFSVLGYGGVDIAVQGSDLINSVQKMEILLVEHELLFEEFSPNASIKRAEVFDIVLDVLKK